MADPVVHITNGVPDSGTGNITTLGAVVTALGSPIQTTGGTVALVAGTAVVGKAGIDQTTDLTTNKVRAFIHDGTTALPILAASSGAPAATVPAIPVSLRDVNANGRALPANSAPVVLNSMTYVTAAASTTQQCGATGASGDYLDGVLIIPGTAAAGVVQIKDGAGSAINIFAGGGTTALPTLAPFFVPIGAVSSGGAGGWKVITNTNVTAVAVGNFT